MDEQIYKRIINFTDRYCDRFFHINGSLIDLERQRIVLRNFQLRFTQLFWYLCHRHKRRRYLVYVYLVSLPFPSKRFTQYVGDPIVPRYRFLLLFDRDIDRFLRRPPLNRFLLLVIHYYYYYYEDNRKLKLIDTKNVDDGRGTNIDRFDQ